MLDNVCVDGAQGIHNLFVFHKPFMLYRDLQGPCRFSFYPKIQSNFSPLECIMSISPFELVFAEGDESLKLDILKGLGLASISSSRKKFCKYNSKRKYFRSSVCFWQHLIKLGVELNSKYLLALITLTFNTNVI